QHQRIVVPPTSTMKENPLQYRVRGTPVPTTRTRGTNYPKSTPDNTSFISNVRPSTVPAPLAGDGEDAGKARENAFIVNEPFIAEHTKTFRGSRMINPPQSGNVVARHSFKSHQPVKKEPISLG
ncbi:hypothetical protein ACL1CI_12380, partial [Corynebacterium striatum]